MTCSSCALNVKRALEAAGGRDVEVDWHSGRAAVDTDHLGPRDLAGAL